MNYSAVSTSQKLLKTPLYELHKNLNAKIVPFAGYEMPVQYSTGVIREHLNVRSHAGLFDVSHMGIAEVSGPRAHEFLNFSLTRDLSKLEPGNAAYSLLCRPNGGTVDDLIVYRESSQKFFLVLNASNKYKDFGYLKELCAENNFSGVQFKENFESMGLLALQGPASESLLKKVAKDFRILPKPFSFWPKVEVLGIPVSLAFTGYTGEAGCEIFCASKDLPNLWINLLQAGSPLGLLPIGLAARDTLRTEMGYSLYGHELGEEINPVEAGLSWAVGFEKLNFVGKDALFKAKAEPQKNLVCFRNTNSKQAPRPDMNILVDGQICGKVSSGTLGPSLGFSIGMGLISHAEFKKAKQAKILQVDIRGNITDFEVCNRPFYKRI